jgi:hypothetical protein
MTLALSPLWRPPGVRIQRPRWRRWLDLFSASNGDELLDDDGNVILDASGNAVTSDGAGDLSYCADPHCANCRRNTWKGTASVTLSSTSFPSGCLPGGYCPPYGCTGWDNGWFEFLGGSADGTYDLTSTNCSYSGTFTIGTYSIRSYGQPCPQATYVDYTFSANQLSISLSLASGKISLSAALSSIGGRIPWLVRGEVAFSGLYDCSQTIGIPNNLLCCGNSDGGHGNDIELLDKDTIYAEVAFS